MDFPKDFEIRSPCVPVTTMLPILTKRSPVSSSNWLGSGDVLAGSSGGPGNSLDPASWSQEATAALVSASQQAQTCCGNGREMQMPAFNDPMQMSYSSLLALSITDMTNLASLLRAQIASSSSDSQMMPAASASHNHFLLNSARIATSHSASQMMPATSTNQNHFLPNSAQFATTRSSQTTPAAPSNENHLLLNGNGNSVPTSSTSNSNNWPLRPLVRQSQHVLPTLAPNINSVPEIDITNTFVSKPGISPVTPAKLVQNMKMQDCRVVEIIDLGDDTPASQNIQMNEFGTFQQPREEEPQLTFSTPGVPSRIVSMQQQKGEVNAMSSTEISLQKAEGENQGIDLNKTPQQKPKRKKHRPKVIREGKPAKRPKPVTPKPVTPRRAGKTENLPEGKRKYVRKKKDMASKENPSDELEDTINPQSGSGSKSVRRSLNFVSEDCQARDVRPGLEMMSTHNADYHADIASSSPKSDMKSAQGQNSRVLENPQAAIASYSAKSDMQSVQEWELRMLENSQAAIASSTAQYDMHSEVRRSRVLQKPLSDRISFDLNSSVNQFDAEYLMILQTPNLPPQPSRQGVLRENQLQDEYISMVNNRGFPPQPGRREGENLKKLARKNNYLNVAGKRDISLEDGQNQVASNNISEALLEGTKRDHTLADDAQVSGSISLMHAYNGINNGSESCDTSRDAMCSPEIYKKKKTENIQNEGPTAYSTFACTSSGWKIVPPAQNTSNALTFADAQRVMAHEKWRAEHALLFSQAKRTANNRPVQDQSRPSVGAGFANQTASTPLKPPCHSSEGSQPSTPEKPSERTANNRSLHHRNPPSVNAGVGNQRASTPLKLPSNSAGCQTSTHEKPSGFTCNPDQTPPSHNAGVCNQRTSTPVNLLGHNSAGCQPSTPEKPSEFTYNQGTMGIGPQARIEAAIASNQLKLKARRSRKKEQVPLNPMSFNAKQLGMENEGASSTTDASHRQESLSRNMSAQSTSRKNSRLCRNYVLDFQHTSSYKGSVSRGYQLGTVMLYQDPVDEIVQKLRHLNICEGYKNVTAQEQNALVPYVGGVGTMVVYGGTKKRRPRPKVDLDPESDRVWKLLMGKECDEGDSEMGADKEKWWEEERRVFRGRADSFIARMHLVQGDRRFSKWKGSVVDSVIGVFLTQNVSDHLSSSAYMSLAAKFPARSSGNSHTTNVDKIDSPMPSGDTISGQGKMPEKQSCDLSSVVIHETEQVDEKKMENCHESPESNTGSSTLDYLDGNNLNCHDRELGIGRESPYCGSVTAVTVTSSTSGVEGEDRSLMEDVVSSQNSVVSSQNSSEYLVEAADPGELYSLLNFDSDDLLSEGMGNSFSSFTELLKMASSSGLHEMNDPSNGRTSCLEHGAGINQLKNIGMDQMPSLPTPSDDLSAGPSIYKTNSHFQLIQSDFVSLSCAPSLSCNYQNSVTSKFVGLQNAEVLEEGKHDNVYPNTSTINMTNRIEIMHKQCCPSAENTTKDMEQQALLVSRVASVDTYAPISKSCMQPITSIGSEVHIELNANSQNNLLKESTQASPNGTISSGLSLSGENVASLQQREREATFQVDRCKHEVKDPSQIRNFVTPQTCSTGHNSNNQENTSEGVAVKPNLANEASFSRAESSKNSSKAKNVKSEIDKTKSFDWDSLRKQACLNGVKKERNSEAMDSLDYEALRNADVNVISYTIRERGMNNLLADRIKEFLNRLVRDHGSTDLEWLRDVPPDKAKDYLLSIRGLGLKSVECVRLLTLHHLAFPVDTNVGRIAVRLGWVPLQPLPESLQLHLLEMYPLMETIQKYLWPRLCKLDQRTLYELHYQLITFGKVFCTKSKPNCNACPMRGECKHFASAFASARLALPGPEEKRLVSSTIPNFPEVNHVPIFKSVPHPQLEGCKHTQDHTVHRNCEPIIEEPASPEPECMEMLESAIEDAFFDDPDEIPTIKLDMEEFTHNLQSYIEQNNLELRDGDMSKALIAITPDIASIPMPKLKNVSRLRTEHQVYELPDSHPLLEGMDKRERDDPSPYLLAIWTPGETAQSTEPPKVCCNSHDTGNLCKENTCFSCNSIREANAQVVRGTVLIPCRTAMRGSFPLNGTYFQVNEVFADHDSSRRPIDVPRNWLWNLPKRTVYFGTSVPTIFKGLTTEGIQQCFWRGFVCVRGFDRTTRRPKPLYARLHFPASKTTKDKRAAAEAANKE